MTYASRDEASANPHAAAMPEPADDNGYRVLATAFLIGMTAIIAFFIGMLILLAGAS